MFAEARSVAFFLLLPYVASSNVDISKYSRLYVSYENCVWSPYANGCDQQQDEGYWYTAFAPCYRANAAFTVYGVPIGKESSLDGCSKNTFVGSFFTTTGVDDFLDTLAAAGAQLSGQNDNDDQQGGEVCEIVNEGDEEQGDANEDQEVDYTANNRKMYGSTQSSGLGCTRYHRFAIKTYSGAYCDERASLKITDSLESFNQDLEENAQCILVYDVSADNQENNNEDGEDQQAVNDVDFLDNSEACNVRLYPETCPDPFGRLHSDARAVGQNMQKGTRFAIVRTVFSWILMVIGGSFMGASAWACYNKTYRNDLKSVSSSDSSSKGSRWRTSPFKRSPEDTPEQAKPISSSGKSTNNSSPRKKRRFFRLFSRGASS